MERSLRRRRRRLGGAPRPAPRRRLDQLERILSFKGLPERALETLLLLLGALIVAIVGLIPAQSTLALGLELLLVALVVAVIVLRLPPTLVEETGKEPTQWRISRIGVR